MPVRRTVATVLIALLLTSPAVWAQGPPCPDLFERTTNDRVLNRRNAPTAPLDSPKLILPEVTGSSKLGMFAIIPADESSYHKVFGSERPYTAAGQREFGDARMQIEQRFKQAYVVGQEGQGRQELRGFISKATESYLAIVGHNEAGSLVFPDGTRLPLLQAAQWARESGKIPVFLSCNAKGLLQGVAPGVSSAITFGEAARIGIALARSLEGRTLDPLQLGKRLQEQVDFLESQVKRNIRVRALVFQTSAGLLVIGIVLLLLSDDDDELSKTLPGPEVLPAEPPTSPLHRTAGLAPIRR